MNDDNYDDDDLSDDEIQSAVLEAVNQLLNWSALVAELQTTDAAAEEVYLVCDLVAAYFNIERAEMITEENEDGSYTTRVKGEQPPQPRTTPIPGVIRTKGRPKLRLSGNNQPPPSTTDE